MEENISPWALMEGDQIDTFSCFETGSHYAAVAGLEFTL